MNQLLINLKDWTIEDLDFFVHQPCEVILSKDVIERIVKCRNYLDEKIAIPGAIYYGINTGFGDLCNTVIPKEDLENLQINLVLSHACGFGEALPKELVRIINVLKIRSLSYGNSGVSLDLIYTLLEWLKRDLTPYIPALGSLGASGDLAPLAHFSLPLIGEGGFLDKNGKFVSTREVYAQEGLNPISLKAKEGLALLNGTQLMLGSGVYLLLKLKKLFNLGLKISALSCEGYLARNEAFLPFTHNLRPHQGQKWVASEILRLRNGSEINPDPNTVQDPYSFRCIPQVLGAVYDAMQYAENIFNIEINSVSDNPLIFPDEDLILSAGNFHGEPLALALDHLSLAMTEMANISERRIFRLLAGKKGLPEFLTPQPGINSGLMIAQYSAAALTSLNRQLASPASADNIESSNGQEDHVSMGANAAWKAHKIFSHLVQVLSIELLAAAQAVEFRKPAQTSSELQAFFDEYRQHVTFIEKDVWMQKHIELSTQFIKSKI